MHKKGSEYQEAITLIINCLKYIEKCKAIETIIEKKSKKQEEEKILLLNRYNLDEKKFEELGIKLNKRKETVTINNKSTVNEITEYTHLQYPDAAITFETIHGSKGLEHDNVILLNTGNKFSDFPSTMNDDPIISLFLSNNETYMFAEERRLFYVALTRTKNYTYILNSTVNSSEFTNEIKNNKDVEVLILENIIPEKNKQINKNITNVLCPVCKKEFLQKIISKKEEKIYYKCNSCDYFITSDPFNMKIPCPKCGAFFENKNGQYGSYQKCTNKKCNFTKSIKKTSSDK